ncbi:hypothetical protein PHLCEN_2v3943 [Hermanssonia centrifuga]|uniref:Uncharacterized protein n=1 Tax=Hermanssonia centrifuga TaxID=98765 RepID=A0A2R6Q7J0_9APHY|nr:hypothetical protein PHLCEN_2v3943 [Hermanssonia centrifuga]
MVLKSTHCPSWDLALKLTEENIDEWASLIDQSNWFEDSIIKRNFKAFSLSGLGEESRYAPFAAVANRVLKLARGSLPGVYHSYPIDDIQFARNDPNYMLRIAEHGKLGAFRKPDLLILRGASADGIGATVKGRVACVDVLGFAEFKRGRTALKALLKDVTSKHDLPPMVEFREPAPEDPVAGNFTKKAASVDEALTIKREAAVQAGGYALETAACTYGTRLFVHGIIIDDDKLEFW